MKPSRRGGISGGVHHVRLQAWAQAGTSQLHAPPPSPGVPGWARAPQTPPATCAQTQVLGAREGSAGGLGSQVASSRS